MPDVSVVGLGLNQDDISPAVMKALKRAGAVFGGKRLLGWLDGVSAEKRPLNGPVSDWLKEIAAEAEKHPVCVAASGDPGFFGIAARVLEHFGPDRVEIYPNISSMQAAFARLKTPWQDAMFLSLHARELAPLFSAMMRSDKIALLTDKRNSPDAIARALLERGQGAWRVHILENLGGDDEKVISCTPAQAASLKFHPLNVVVLERTAPLPPFYPGRDDKEYEHQKGLITKSEHRAVILSRLRLRPEHILWDLGAGSGSVGLEACHLLYGGRVCAVEKDPDRVAVMAGNRSRLMAANLEIIKARLPEGLQGLPDPDRVFIGGGGADLAAIIRSAWRRLKESGLILVSAVRLEALESARSELAALGGDPELTQLSVSRGAELAGGVFMKPLNPLWLIRARKGAE